MLPDRFRPFSPRFSLGMSYVFRCLSWLAAAWLLAGAAYAQSTVGYGDWQQHLPTNHPLRLADAGDRVYVATENAFYYLDKELNTTQVLTRRDGLNDVGVVAVAYDSVTRQTVLAYRNTNIDIIRPNGSVQNLNDILRKVITSKKVINHIYIGNHKTKGNRAYLGTTFGLVVLNLDKLEVTDTYTNIGPLGVAVNVYSTTLSATADTLFAATSAGLLVGRTQDNLLDYHNWTQYQPAGVGVPIGGNPNDMYRSVATYNKRVYAFPNDGNPAGASGVLMLFQPHSPNPWLRLYGGYTTSVSAFRPSTAGLLIAGDTYGVRRYNPQLPGLGFELLVPPAAANDHVVDIVRSKDGNYYVANYETGLQRVKPGNPVTRELFQANGPERNLAFSILADARTNTVDVFSGRVTDRYEPTGYQLGFYEFAKGQWTNISSATTTAAEYPNPPDVIRGTRSTNGTLYIASFGGGVLEWKGPGQFRQFTPTNSPLVTGRITDVAADKNGNVWVANRHLLPNTSGLFMLNPNTDPPTWTTTPHAPGLDIPDRLALDDNGYVWTSVSRKTDGSIGASPGIYAVDPSGNNPPRFFSTVQGLPNDEVYDIVKDRNGEIWVGTLKGVGQMTDPSGAFTSNVGFSAPIVRRGEGSNFPVLFNEPVRALAVDGGNRKWMGTDHGLWLFSENADEALLHFTVANSPLPSDRVVDVEVNDKTGEVWIATDAGVISYRGSATVTEGEPSCTQVSPNPVRPEFSGTVGISGLANNAMVKITDVAGHLVYSTKASGGTVTWNMTNVDGQRVRSGVYLVLSSDADGKNGCVSKVAVLSK
jgi:hypothetical protein